MAATATALVVDGRMEPVTKAEATTQLVVTGQGLWDMFMVANEADKTRMGFIRSLVDTADALQIGGACDAMVDRAILMDYPEGKPKKAERLSKEQQARNVVTTIRQAWGALKFAREALNAQGYDENTGWNPMRVMAPAALKAAGKVWNGIDVPTDAQKEQAKLQRANKAQTDAFIEATKETPRALNESYESWQARVATSARTKVDEAASTARAEQAANAFKKLVEKHDRATLATIAHLLLEHLKEDNAGQSEVSEAEADALLAAAAQAGDVEVTDEETEEA